MKLSMNTEDMFLCIDDTCFHVESKDIPSDVHAIQFESKTGHIEYKDGSNDLIGVKQKIRNLKEVHWIRVLIDQHQKLCKEAPKQIKEEVDPYWAGVEELEKKFPKADPKTLATIMTTHWPNLKLALRLRKKDNAILGIDVIDAVGAETGTSTTTLKTIKRLFAQAKKDGAVVFSDVNPSIIDKEKYCKYLESCGAEVKRTKTYCYMRVNA